MSCVIPEGCDKFLSERLLGSAKEKRLGFCRMVLIWMIWMERNRRIFNGK